MSQRVRQHPSLSLVANMILSLATIIGATGHIDLHGFLLLLSSYPLASPYSM